MIVRVLLLFLSLVVLLNLFIMALCYITGENLYKKYGRQMIIAFAIFVLLVGALYVAFALIGLG